jgi:hypothetical protein
VSKNLIVYLALEFPPLQQRQQTSYYCAAPHDSANRNRVTRAVALSQFATSMLSCFNPALVNE